MVTNRRPVARTTVNLLLDTTVFVAFLAVTAPKLTGLAIHEWLGLAFGGALITHILLHWSWVVGVTKRFFGKVSWGSRVNYLLNILLFVAFTALIFTGVMISEVAIPLLGVSFEGSGQWKMIHKLASDASVILIGLHVALHWRWIVNTTRRLLSRPVARPLPRPSDLATHTTQEVAR
jgi:cytochrome b561